MENIISKIVRFTRSNNKRCQSVLLLGLRVLFGWLLFQAGYGKLGNMEGVIGFFGSLGIPAPAIQAYFVAYLEMLGGLLLIAGFATRIIAFPLSITMVVALLTAHREELTELSEIVSTTPFPYLVVLIVTIAFGPGRFSLDQLIISAVENGKKGWLFEKIRCIREGC